MEVESGEAKTCRKKRRKKKEKSEEEKNQDNEAGGTINHLKDPAEKGGGSFPLLQGVQL